ncbi:MAG: TusE/DsrC/DsvC family sulfur relay protein [Gammaproteobacteria bacterium]
MVAEPTMDDIMHPGWDADRDPGFPNAPHYWTPATATGVASELGLELQQDHWDTLRALQEYYARHEDGQIQPRDLHDALEERFHGKGGIRYLYQLFPGGPVAQGCRLAGLEPPAGAVDRGFGSVV